jgi:hypothetical protein
MIRSGARYRKVIAGDEAPARLNGGHCLNGVVNYLAPNLNVPSTQTRQKKFLKIEPVNPRL